MKEDRCPFAENCFIIGSLQALPVPHIITYCSQSYESCRYYRRQVQAERKDCREVMV